MRAARRDGAGQTETGRLNETIAYARQLAGFRQELADAAFASCVFGDPVERQAGEFFEIGHRIVVLAEIAADALREGLDGEVMAVVRVQLAPGLIDGAFGVEDEAVEVEDDGADGGEGIHDARCGGGEFSDGNATAN